MNKKRLNTFVVACLYFICIFGFTKALRKPIYSYGKYRNNEKEWTLKHVFNSTAIFCHTILFRKYPSEEQKAPWIAKPDISERSENPAITWIGHSTFLIQVGNLNILTDPVYGDLQPLLYPRILPEGVPFDDLPPIDAILISHNHRDHLDKKTLLKLLLLGHSKISYHFISFPLRNILNPRTLIFQRNCWTRQPNKVLYNTFALIFRKTR